MTQRKVEYWVIPPQADAEFVAHMEQVLDRDAPSSPILPLSVPPLAQYPRIYWHIPFLTLHGLAWENELTCNG